MLAEFLALRARRPFAWGRDDCCLLLADWWLAVHGVDPAADWRGTYASESECTALLARSGGLLRLVARTARRSGAKRIATAEPGAFGVARHQGLHIAGIVAPDGKFASRSARGLICFSPARMAALWSIA